MTLVLVIGTVVGMIHAGKFVIPPEIISLRDLRDGSLESFRSVPLFSTRGVLIIWFHNMRAIFLAMLLGIFSFGALGVITLAVPLMLVGYFMATMAAAGVAPGTFFLAFIMPHGVFEIPAIIIAGAAIIKIGASLATPARGKSIAEALLQSLGDGSKILVGVVIPLLLVAAIVEALLTPHIAVWLLNL